jgi:hypothetical protein
MLSRTKQNLSAINYTRQQAIQQQPFPPPSLPPPTHQQQHGHQPVIQHRSSFSSSFAPPPASLNGHPGRLPLSRGESTNTEAGSSGGIAMHHHGVRATGHPQYPRQPVQVGDGILLSR